LVKSCPTVDSKIISSALVDRGILKINEGRYESALADLREGLAIAEELGDRTRIARFHLHIGSIYLSQSDLFQSIAHLETVLEINNQGTLLPAKTYLAALAGLGTAHLEISDFSQASVYFERCIKGYPNPRSGCHGPVLRCLTGYGDIASEDGDFNAASLSYSEVLEITHSKLGSPGPEAMAHVKLGNLYLSQAGSGLTQALTHYITASIMHRHARIFEDLPLSLAGISDVLLQAGDVATASTVNDVAMSMFQRHGARRGIGHCLRRRAEISILRDQNADLARQQLAEARDWCVRATDKKGAERCERRLKDLASQDDQIA